MCMCLCVCVCVCVCSRIKIIKMGAVCCCAIKVMIGFKRSYEQKQVQDTQCSQYFTMFSFTIVIVKTLRKYKKIVNNNSKITISISVFLRKKLKHLRKKYITLTKAQMTRC